MSFVVAAVQAETISGAPHNTTLHHVIVNGTHRREDCDDLLMIVMHPGVTEAMVNRSHHFAKQLNAACKGLAMAILFNANTAGPYAKYDASRLGYLWHSLQADGLLGTTVVVHEVSASAVMARFPKLAEADTKARTSGHVPPDFALLWVFHVEPALVLWESLMLRDRNAFKWVWMLESDVVFTGNIKWLFDKHHDTQADVLAESTCFKIDDPAQWGHINASSKEFEKRFLVHERYRNREGVLRVSSRFLHEIGKLADMGAHAWSEQVWCTVAKKLGFTATHIANNYRVSGSTSLFTDHKHMQRSIGAAGANKFYHPVKF